MHKCVNGNKIYVSNDKTTNSEGCFVANGTLVTNSPGQTFLLTLEVLEAANHSQKCKLFDKSMHLLWPNAIQYRSMLLFPTDGVTQ